MPNRPLFLDTGPLGQVVHPRQNKPIHFWLQRVLEAGIEVVVPEICDYELKRNLLIEGLTESLRRLDVTKGFLSYRRITTPIMVRAAELWAEARREGRPSADKNALDADVILAASAEAVGGIVITDNIGHLNLFVEARHWTSFEAPGKPI